MEEMRLLSIKAAERYLELKASGYGTVRELTKNDKKWFELLNTIRSLKDATI